MTTTGEEFPVGNSVGLSFGISRFIIVSFEILVEKVLGAMKQFNFMELTFENFIVTTIIYCRDHDVKNRRMVEP